LLKTIIFTCVSRAYFESLPGCYIFRSALIEGMKNDDVFELIKALTTNEKRYFKIFARQHGEESIPKYIELFDAMDSLEHFNLDKLGEVLTDKRIMKYINQEKKYLKDKILDSLRAFRGDKSVDVLIFRLLEDQLILYEKGLYSQCHRQLTKAKKLAETFDRCSQLVDILAIEQKLLIELEPQELEETIERIDQEQRLAITKLQNLVAFQNIWRTLLVHYRKDGYRDTKHSFALLEDPQVILLLSHIENAKSFSAKHLYYLSTSLVQRLKGSHEDASRTYLELIKLWDERPDRIEEEAMQYILVLSNYLNLQHKVSKYSDFPRVIAAIRDVPTSNFGEEAEVFQNIAQLELLYFLNNQIFLDQIPDYYQMEIEVLNGLNKYGDKINAARKLSICHNMMLVKFFSEDWPGANRWRARIENDENAKKIRREIYDFAKIMQLIIEFELKEYDWILDLYRNHSRSLERQNRMNNFFARLLKGIQTLAVTKDVSIQRKVMQNMKNEVSAELLNKGQANILGGKEVLIWLNFKIEGSKPLRDFMPRES
jgi:hypothetical protein